MTEKLKRKTIYFLLLPLLAAAAAGYCFCLPRTLFDEPFSATVWSRDGRLMSAKVASDGQWRFFPTDSVPYKFRVAITTYEDKRFYRHFGVDPLALGRAVRQNLASGRVASGASTLTMQTIRLSRGRKARTLPGKDRRGGAGDPAGIQMRQGGDTRPVRLPRPLRRQCDRAGERRMVLFRPQRRQPLVGRERHARRTAEFARAHPYQAQPGAAAGASGTTCWNGYGAAGISTP